MDHRRFLGQQKAKSFSTSSIYDQMVILLMGNGTPRVGSGVGLMGWVGLGQYEKALRLRFIGEY